MDPIVEQALKAVQGLVAGTPATGRSNQVMEVRVEQNRSPATPQRTVRSAGLDGGVSVSTRGSGYLEADSEPAGTALNPEAQLGIFARIRKESDWLRFTTFAPVTEQSGYLDTWDDRSFRMHPMPTEGVRSGIPIHKPDVDASQYQTRTISGAFGIRLTAIKAAKRAGQDVNQLVRRGIATGIGNVLADLGINGSTALPTDTDLNIQRSAVDGWLTKIRANSANYQGRDAGFSYHNGIWAGMIQQLDKSYRSHPGLAWGITDSIGSRWLTELTATGDSPSNAHPSIVNSLGSNLLNAMGAQANPMGKPGVVIPQLIDDGHSTDEGYDGMAPTSLVNNGDGTLTININTLATSGVNRSDSGADGQRYVTVGRLSTGVEETLAVAYSAPNNTVTTAGLLGQTVVSTTAADYYVKWADVQPIMLGVFPFLTMVVRNGMRIYTVFYPHDEKIEVIVHIDLDFLVVDYDGVSLTDDLITPRFSVLPAL